MASIRRNKVSTVFEELYRAKYSLPQYQRSGYAYEVRLNWQNHLAPFFGRRLISKVTVPSVHDWHLRYLAWPYAGNRSKSLLSSIFSFAELKGYYVPQGNPCRAVPNHRERQRNRYAGPEELVKLGELLKAALETHPREAIFIYFLLYTGSRPSAVERFTWNNLVFTSQETGFFRVNGKSGEERVEISAEMMQLLDRLPREGRKGASSSEVVCTFPRSFWERLREKAGCPDLWARDLRRTFATIGLSHGLTLGAVGELLNHKKLQTTMRYAKLMPTSRGDAVGLISGEITKRIG